MNYPHVFKYGQKAKDGSQRWAFAFSVVLPDGERLRVRVCEETCAGAKPFTYYFHSAEEAALRCDVWKFKLNSDYALNIPYSLGCYESFADRFSAWYGCRDPHDHKKDTPEMEAFVQEHEAVLAPLAKSNAWNPHAELFEAQRNVEKAKSEIDNDRAGWVDTVALKKAEARLQWAQEFADHCKLMEDVNAYGRAKLEAEAKVYADCLRKAVNYTKNFSARPVKAHRRLVEMFEGLRNVKAFINNGSADADQTYKAVIDFLKQLDERLEQLKKQRP